MKKTSFLLFILILVFSCKKPDERACLKKSGDNTKRIINLGDFSRVYLKEHLNYVMIQDTANYLVVDGGENLVGFINCTIDGDELIVSNENKCKFLRYKTGKITVEIHFVSLTSLVYQGTELLTNRNNWNFNQMSIVLKDAGGTMDLTNFNGNALNLVNSHGWGDIKLSGSANFFRAEMSGNGYFDSRNFIVQDSISVISNSSTISKLNTDSCILKAQLKSIGDVWYYGYPLQIWKEEFGAGKLVDMN
jgi:hypothetical protein